MLQRETVKMMIIKVPESIKVGGHTFAIAFSSDAMDDGHFAKFNLKRQRIELDTSLVVSMRAAALIHEILHAVDFVYTNHHCEESAIEALAQGIYQVMEQLGIELDWSLIKERGADDNKATYKD